MVEIANPRTQADPRFAVHLAHTDADKRRKRTLCERPIGLGDDAVLPYDVVGESQMRSVDCRRCLDLAGAGGRHWRSPAARRPPA